MKTSLTGNTLHVRLLARDAQALDTRDLKDPTCKWLLSEITYAMHLEGVEVAELYAPGKSESFATVRAE